MGARQRAQNRAKNGKGSQKGSPWSNKKSNAALKVPHLDPSFRHRALQQGWQDYADSHSSPPKHGFSMSDEARNTERHTFGWGTTKLRHNTIAFVSAGNLTQEDPMSNKVEESETEDDNVEEEQGKENPDEIDNQSYEAAIPVAKEAVTQVGPIINVERTSSPQILDVSVKASTDLTDTKQRRLSNFSSSDEEIVFAGRQTPRTDQAESGRPINLPLRQSVPGKDSEETTNVEEDALRNISENLSASKLKARGSSDRQENLGPSLEKNETISDHLYMTDDEEALMQDYIANMVMDDDDEEEEEEEELTNKHKRTETFRFFSGDGLENAKVQTLKPKRRSKKKIDLVVDWDSADLEDFDDLSTTDEDVIDISQVLRFRQRPTGSQYLVTAIGKGASEARWMPEEKLVSQTALKEIQIFREMQNIEFEDDSDVSETTDSGSNTENDALNDVLDQMDSEDDENDRILKRTSRMTDEQIALALAKQEEMGLGGDELLLFDDQYYEEDDLNDDEFARGNDFVSFATKKQNSTSKKKKRHEGSFPSAAAFADALDEDLYGGFDIMDFERPSLRPKRKGRKSDFPFDLELDDDDLKEQLYNTWMKDRTKKASRKREKALAREAALFDTEERGEPGVIRAEIRRFLIEETASLRLAPMTAQTRAGVHRLAKALKLKSHSQGKEGKGEGRFPILTKTAHTPSYTIDTIWKVDDLLNARRFFPVQNSRSKGGKLPRGATMKMRRGGGGVASGATYMNGEIVGGDAPELGSDNKGRAMLEKMGWTSGMAIGAVGNKGSLEAIKHVVKTTRAGLG